MIYSLGDRHVRMRGDFYVADNAVVNWSGPEQLDRRKGLHQQRVRHPVRQSEERTDRNESLSKPSDLVRIFCKPKI